MPAPSLRRLALRTAIKNVDDIEYVPEVPYDCIRPLLRNVRTAAQLQKIESTSPHIVGRNAEIWKTLIKRDADVDIQDIPEPKDPARWWKVHRKLLQERDAKFEKAAAALKEAMNKHEADKESCSTGTLPRTAVYLPKRTSGWARADQPRPASGSSFLSRAREQTREKAMMRKSTGLLKGSSNNPRLPSGSVASAPKGLSDKLPGPSQSRPTVPTSSRPATRPMPRMHPHMASSTTNPTRGKAPTPLIGKRKLAPASNVFGPTKRR